MDWYYAESGQQKGPVSDEQFQNLVRDGVVKPDTLVWHEGMANWQRHGGASGGGGASPATATAQSVPQPLAPAPAPTGGVTPDEILARDYNVDIGDGLSGGWEAVKGAFWQCIGATTLVYLVMIVTSLVPFIGGLVQFVIQGPMMGGLNLFYIKRVRGQEVVIGDAFSGFGPRFVHLMLTSIVSGILVLLCIVPGIGVTVIGAIVTGVFHQGGRPNFAAAAGAPVLIIGAILVLIGVAVMIYLGVSWVFALWLVADKHMDFWKAMNLSRKVVAKHWWMTFAYLIVGAVIAMLGMLGLCVGVLVTVSIYLGMIASLYNRIFGDMAQQES
ncbi:MAG: DUF4339 domain-containing protein [Verrucomicrobia bacterium]|nr:DUF4339 domain-containing protein [Verrucomicrobiota bacterium]